VRSSVAGLSKTEDGFKPNNGRPRAEFLSISLLDMDIVVVLMVL
jgi:hypothetical protein